MEIESVEVITIGTLAVISFKLEVALCLITRLSSAPNFSDISSCTKTLLLKLSIIVLNI